MLAFEEAEKEVDPEDRQAWLTFLIIGGGPTGVEEKMEKAVTPRVLEMEVSR